MSAPIDQKEINRLSVNYQKQMRNGFFAAFKRKPFNDKELIAFSLATFIISNEEFIKVCDSAAGVARLYLPKEQADKFTKYAAFSLIKEAITTLQVLADLQAAEAEAKGEKLNSYPNVFTPIDPKDMT